MSASRRARRPALEFHGPIEGYVANYVTKNAWKVGATLERGEIFSEAWLVYAKVCDRYPGVEAAHLMALFKTSWHRRFLELARRDSDSRATFVAERTARGEDGEERPDQEPAGETENAGVLASLVRGAPREVLLVLQLFLNAPAELLEAALSTWEGPREDRSDGGSLRLNQLLGLDPSYDCVGAVRAHFEGSARITIPAVPSGG